MLTSGLTENNLLLTDIVPSMPQLLDNSKLLQTRTSQSAVPPTVSRNCLPVVSRGIRWINRLRTTARALRCHQLD